jgi:hypothetical protein
MITSHHSNIRVVLLSALHHVRLSEGNQPKSIVAKSGYKCMAGLHVDVIVYQKMDKYPLFGIEIN